MITADATEQPGAPQDGLLIRHSLVFYFLMAYAFSWLPLMLSEDGIGLLPFRGDYWFTWFGLLAPPGAYDSWAE